MKRNELIRLAGLGLAVAVGAGAARIGLFNNHAKDQAATAVPDRAPSVFPPTPVPRPEDYFLHIPEAVNNADVGENIRQTLKIGDTSYLQRRQLPVRNTDADTVYGLLYSRANSIRFGRDVDNFFPSLKAMGQSFLDRHLLKDRSIMVSTVPGRSPAEVKPQTLHDFVLYQLEVVDSGNKRLGWVFTEVETFPKGSDRERLEYHPAGNKAEILSFDLHSEAAKEYGFLVSGLRKDQDFFTTVPPDPTGLTPPALTATFQLAGSYYEYGVAKDGSWYYARSPEAAQGNRPSNYGIQFAPPK